MSTDSKQGIECAKRVDWKALLILLRPHHWSKNLVVFAALIFSYSIFEPRSLLSAVLAFASFCLFSSCAYIFNDIRDVNEDRHNPRKKHRPLAANRVSVRQAVLLFSPTFLAALSLALLTGLEFTISALTYLAIALVYTLWLKHVVIIDLFAIASGFLIRALAGALAIDVEISPWFLFCTLLLSLFLALTKRRQEYVQLAQNRGNHRKVLEQYTPLYLDQLIAITTASTIIAYSFYTFTAGPSVLFMLTIPFVIYGIFRYLYLIYRKEAEESPDQLIFKDAPLVATILLWVIISLAILGMA